MADGSNYTLTEEEIRAASERLKAQEDERRSYRQKSWDMTQPPPDQAAEALALGGKFGVPRQAVEADPDYWRRRDKEAQDALMRSASPRVMAWMDNADNYAVAKDDVSLWSDIERGFGDMGRALAENPAGALVKTGNNLRSAVRSGWLSMNSTTADIDREQLEKAAAYYDAYDEWKSREDQRKAEGKGGWLNRIAMQPITPRLYLPGDSDPMPQPSDRLIREAMKPGQASWQKVLGIPGAEYRNDPATAINAIRPMIEDAMRDAVRVSQEKDAAADAAMPQTGNFVADNLLAGIRSLTEMAPLVASAIATRGKTVPAAVMGGQVYYNEFSRGRDAELDLSDSTNRALLQAGVETISERISLGIIDDMLKSDRGIVQRFVGGMIAEQGQEQIATMGSRLVDWAYLDSDKTLDQFLAETPRSMVQTSLATFVASAGMQGTFLAVDAITQGLAKESVFIQPSANEKRLSTLIDKVSGAKLSTRSPEKAAELAGRLTEGTDLETVTVDLDGVASALQQAGIDPAEALSALGVTEEQLAQKYERFGEIEVSTATLITSPLMRENRQLVEPHVRAGSDQYTPAKKEALRTEFDAEVKDGVARIQEAIDGGRALVEKEQAVVDRVRERLSGSGMFPERVMLDKQVAIQAATVNTFAKRLGVDPVEFYEQHFPKIQGSIDGMVMEENALEQARTEGYEGEDRGEAVSWLAAKRKGLDMSVEGRMARAKEMGFDTETVLYHGTDKAGFDSFDVNAPESARSEGEEAVFLTNNPTKASTFAGIKNQSIMPLYVRGRIKTLSAEDVPELEIADGTGQMAYHSKTFSRILAQAKAEGFDGVRFKNVNEGAVGDQIAIFDPSNIRSVHAAFDPDNAGSANLLDQLIGSKAKSADKAILNRAKAMAKEKVKNDKGKKVPKYTRQQIWDETAKLGQPWYQDDNGDWISEIEDGTIVVKDAKGPLSEVIEFPSLYAEYPALTKMKADTRSKVKVQEEGGKDLPGTKGVFTPNPFLFGAHVRISDRGKNSREYTVTHELQHAVDHLENREMGRNKPYLLKDTERRAFNTMYRRLWTMEERIATPPWKTEQEAIDWMMGQRDLNADAAKFAKDGTFDPGSTIRPPEQTMPKTREDENVPTGARERDLAMPKELVRGIHYGDRVPRADLKTYAPPAGLLGRTFLSIRDLMRSAAKNERIAEVLTGLQSPAKGEYVFRADLPKGTTGYETIRTKIKIGANFEPIAMIGEGSQQADERVRSLMQAIGATPEEAEVLRIAIARDMEGPDAVLKSLDQMVKNRPDLINNQDVGRLRDMARGMLKTLGEPETRYTVPRTKAEEAKEAKRLEVALADKLLDMDKTIDQQPANVRTFFEEMIAEQQSRPDLIAGGYDYTQPGYFDGMTAGALMRSLAEAQFSESGIRDPMIAMIQRLRAAGIVGARYVPGGVNTAEDAPPQTQSIVIFDERAPVLLTDQSGNLMQERRGQFSPDTNTVTLFEQSDVTTMLHEGAHWYLDLVEKMAKAPDPHPFVVEQYQAVQKWYEGVKSTPALKAARLNYRIQQQGSSFVLYEKDGAKEKLRGRFASQAEAEARIDWIEMHETWAETFEVYVYTGKAPSEALRSTFIAFKDWITKLWKRLYGNGQPARANLNPEVIAIMDRMLAVDEEIDAAVADVFIPFEAQAKALRAQGALTQKEYERALEKAKEDFGARVMADKMREDEAWWNTEKRRVRGDVVRELDRSPIGRALSWLGYGQWKGDVPVGETEQQDDGAEFYQSIRAATRMPMPEVDAWVRDNVSANIQTFQNGDESMMMQWPLTEDPDAPTVLMSIRLNRKGRADVNLFLDNKMADALENVEDVNERRMLATEMFSQAVMVMRQYAAETPDLKAFNFIAAESQAEGTKAKSREELYRFMLSTLKLDGYTAYEVTGQMSVVREEGGAKMADPLFTPGSSFVLVKDGVDANEFARTEILRGSQRGGSAGEVVTALKAVQLTRPARGGMGRGGREAGGPDTGGVVGDQNALNQLGPQRSGDRGRRDQGRRFAPLAGAPNVQGASGPDQRLVQVAESYAQAQGLDLRRQAEYARVDPERAARIAQAYEDMQHAPNDPAVRAAYEDLIRQTIEQYRALEAAGYRFWFFDETIDPYEGNPWNAMRDLRANQRMGVFSTVGGFGSGATDLNVEDNPMLAETGIEWPVGSLDGEMRPVLANDLFRAVHDAFGHGLEGAGFRAQGEENAWQAHVRLFTGPAVGAITSETRGQNSWLNFGPYGEANRTAAVEDTVFADQKTGLMPEWTWTEGRVPDMDDGVVDNSLGQQGAEQKTLFVAHNTSEEKLRKTLELGGFPMPSLAVARTDKGGFPSFGEITFLADPKLLDESDVTAYDADIYSPTVPEKYPKVSPEKAGAFVKKAKALIPEGAMIPEYLGYDETDRDLPRTLMNSELVQLAYLSEQGKAPKLKKLKVAKEVKAALKTEYESPERAAFALAYYTRLDQELNAARAEKGIEPTNIWVEDDGSISYRNQRNFDDLISEAKRSPFDQKAYKSELYNRTMGSLVAREKFAKYTAELAGEITESYRIFKGFTYSGNRKWVPFNLENVMAEMRKDLREGNHDSFGGTGSIRARVGTTAMPKMKDVQRNRDRIVSEDEMRAIKDRQSERFMELANDIAKYYKFAATGLRYYDAAAEAIALGPKEWRESFAAEALPAIRAYVEELKALPTEYFEAKANRVMQLGDFAAAVVPRNVSPDILQAIRAAGVDVRFYKRGDEADRLRAVQQMEGLLFQPGDPKGWGETAPPPDLPPMRLDLEATERLYGKEAVAKLPKAIRDRGRDQTSIDSMFAIARATAKTLRRKPPKSLFQFIRSRKARTVEGKTVPVKQWGIRGAADELKAMDRADLINEENGIHIDYMRELAEEAGYLSEGSTVNDMLNAIDREARGEPVYSSQDQNEVLDYQNAEEWANWFDEQGVDITEKDEKALRAKLAKVVTSTAADAVTPDQAAELLGFNTGEELLAALAEIGNRERFIQAETDRRMAAEFGDPYKDGTFAEAARQAAESEVKARAAEIELEALARAVGESAASKMAKQMAEESLALMTVKELAGWTKFLDAERRHGRNALAATKKGDMVEAMLHKRRQLVSMHLARAAREKSEALEKTRKDLMSYLTSKGRRDKIDRGYLDKIEALLDSYELRVSKQGPGTQRARLSAKQYVEQMIADGREAEIAPEAMLLAEMADAKVWRDLLAEEADYLAGTVKNLAHLGRTKNKLMKAQDKRRFDAVVAELVDTLTAAGPLKGAQREYSFRKTAGEKLSSGLRTSHAWLMRMEHQLRALDGRANGPLWNGLFRIFADAADVESQMMRETAKEVRAAYDMYSGLERYRMHNVSIEVPELGRPVGKRWTKMEIISIALNWGVAYNRQALIDGYAKLGWTDQKVQAALDRLMTDKDWDFVEQVWKVSGKYKAEAFALEKAMTGVEPKAVEGIEFTTGSGRVIKGKYYHLEYDSRQLGQKSRRQKKQDDKEALSDRMKSFTKPQTKNGGLIARVGSGGKPVKLHISVFDQAMADTIHDIAYRRAVIDAGRIINDPRFADAYELAAGKEAYDQLEPWLASIVKPPSEQAAGGLGLLVAVRRNLPIAYMGYKVGTALIQSTGLLAAVPELGLRWVAQGFAKSTVGSPLSLLSAWQAVAEKSEFMRDRPQGYDRDVREVTTAMGESTPLGAMKRNAFILISAMDLAVSVPIWVGAYDKAMEGKVEGVDAGNDVDAIAYADAVVRRTQTAGRPQDLARVSRDSELWKQVTMLFGYFSNLYSYTSQQVRAVRTGETAPPQFLLYMAIMFVAIPILTELVAGRLLPDEDEEDEKTLAGNMGKAVISNFSGMFPVVRDFVNYGLEPKYGYKLSPVASGMNDVAMSVTAPLDGEMTEAEYKRTVRALGALLGVPSSQLVITGDYINDLLAGEEDPAEDPLDAAREALVRDTR